MGRRKPTYPRPTGFVGIQEVQESVFKARIRFAPKPGSTTEGGSGQYRQRTFDNLPAARLWRRDQERERDSLYPVRKCESCGREFHARPYRGQPEKVCSSICRRRRIAAMNKLNPTRKSSRIEPHISSVGQSFRVQVVINGRPRIKQVRTLAEARSVRESLLRERERARTRTCPVCSQVFRARSGRQGYCSRTCGGRAKKLGILVVPGKALPSTRRKARERQREELRQYERDLIEQGRPLLREMERKRIHGEEAA